MAHPYNPTHSGGRDGEDCGSRTAWAKKSYQGSISNNKPSKVVHTCNPTYVESILLFRKRPSKPALVKKM
jgi:hypothetical protein